MCFYLVFFFIYGVKYLHGEQPNPKLGWHGVAEPQGKLRGSWRSTWERGFFPLTPNNTPTCQWGYADIRQLFSWQKSKQSHVRLPGLGEKTGYGGRHLCWSCPPPESDSPLSCPFPLQKVPFPASKPPSCCPCTIWHDLTCAIRQNAYMSHRQGSTGLRSHQHCLSSVFCNTSYSTFVTPSTGSGTTETGFFWQS